MTNRGRLALALGAVALSLAAIAYTGSRLSVAAAPDDDRGLVQAPADGLRAARPSSREWGGSPVEPATSNAEQQASRRVRVRTEDAHRSPLSGVRLYERDDEGYRSVGVTGRDGFAVFTPSAGPGVAVIAVHDGHVSARRMLFRPPPEELVLTLYPAAPLGGQVVLADGRAAHRGVLVLAIPEARYQTAFRTRPDRLVGDPEVAAVETDVEGRFEIPSLDPNQRYALVAGAPGRIQKHPPFARPGGDEVVLVLHPCYGALVELNDPEGGPPLASKAFGAGIGASARIVESDTFFASRRDLCAWLAGAPVETTDVSGWQRVYAAGSEVERPFLTLQYEAHPPGYGKVSAEILLTPLEGELAVVPLALERDTDGFGSLVIRTVGARARPAERLGESGPFAVLTLQAEDGSIWKYPLNDHARETHRIDGIPFGTYELSLEVTPYLFFVPAAGEARRFVEIGAEERELVLDTGDTGAVELFVDDGTGGSFEGELKVFIGPRAYQQQQWDPSEGDFYGGQVLFHRPPYVLPIVAAQEYLLVVESPLPETGRQTVRVQAGRTARVDVRLRTR